MKKIIYYLTIITLLSNFSNCTAQKRVMSKCNAKELASIEKKINNLKYEDICSFFTSIDKECKNNVEFSEYHNELLFKITNLYPAYVLKSISKLDNSKKLLIMDEYSSNILDFRIDDLKKKLDSIKGFEKIKKDIYNSLEANR